MGGPNDKINPYSLNGKERAYCIKSVIRYFNTNAICEPCSRIHNASSLFRSDTHKLVEGYLPQVHCSYCGKSLTTIKPATECLTCSINYDQCITSFEYDRNIYPEAISFFVFDNVNRIFEDISCYRFTTIRRPPVEYPE